MDAEPKPQPMGARLLDRLRWLGRLFLLLFVLGSAAFLSAITTMRFAIEGRVVRMPNVVSRSFGDAQAALRFLHLGVVVADHVYSNIPVDAVVRQSPPPGTEIKVGQQVDVVLSLGAQKVRVPSLLDRSLPVARLELLTAGLQLGEVSYIYSAGEPADLILQQDPLPGETGVASPRVSLLVSLGPRPPAFVMPDLRGLSVADADRRLETAGVTAPSVAYVANPGAPVGSIVGQTPSAGGRVDSSTNVLLDVVSLSSPPSTAPPIPAQTPKAPPKPLNRGGPALPVPPAPAKPPLKPGGTPSSLYARMQQEL